MPTYFIEKFVQGTYNQAHPKYGETAGIQCACNALLAACWAKIRKVSLWCRFDLDHVLDLGDALFKRLGLHRYLDASDLPNELTIEGNMCHVNKFYLHDGEARICNTRFLIDPFRIGNVALLFMNHTVTTIFAVGPTYYLFDSHSRDSRGLVVSDGLSVLLKFTSLQQLENYIKVIHLEYQGR